MVKGVQHYLPVAKPLLKTEILRWEAALEAHINLEAISVNPSSASLSHSLSLSRPLVYLA